MRTSTFAAIFVVLLLPTSLSAKGTTSRITLRDTSLQTSIDITDQSVLKDFIVWAGPGTFSNEVEGTQGFIIDWPAGIVADRPTGLHRYEVMFYVRDRNPPDEELVYTVFYERDPSSGQGFVYLPGHSDAAYRLNTRTILRGHGLEGNWFHAATAWQKAVETLLSDR
jgi:hypothetical protein